MKSMSFTVFSYNATVLLIQPNPTEPMDGPNPCPSLADTAVIFLLFLSDRLSHFVRSLPSKVTVNMHKQSNRRYQTLPPGPVLPPGESV